MNAKRLIASIFLLISATAAAFAALPQTISYQGYVKDSGGTPVNGATSMTFSLYSSTRAGSGPVWRETQNAIAVDHGIYSVQLGSASPITAPFDAPYWLGVNINGSGELPLQPFTSTGYAFRAGVADSVSSSATLSGQTLAQLDSRYINPTVANPTPLQLATLRWDQARSGTITVQVGTSPGALVFDGSSIWVANSSSNSVMKINPATGAVGQPISVGSNPVALAFDGSSIWVANYWGNSVQKISLATGTVGPPINVGINPVSLAYDGSSIWVANWNSNSIQKINPTTGAVSPPITNGIYYPRALAFDGINIWVANQGSDSVTKVDPATGTTIMASSAVGREPVALAFDGSSIWVANQVDNNVVKLDLATAGTIQTIPVGNSPQTLTFDGSSIWVITNSGLMKIDPATGSTGTPITAVNFPSALAYDGSSIWVANASNNSVTKLARAGLSAGIQTVSTSTLLDNSVTSSKIANNAVTDAKITGPISAAKLDLSTRVAKTGDIMTGTLSLPVNGLAVGTTQLVAYNGNVGINTATPGFTLDVNGTGRVTSNFDLTAAGSQIGFNRNSTNGAIYNSSNNAWQIGPNGANDPFVISAWSTGGALLSKPLVLTTDGKAGLGTSTPKRPLHIAGEASAEMNLEATGGMTDWKNWNLLVDGGGGAKQNLTFRILNDAGTASMRNALVLWNDGNATLAGTLTQTSDLRLKTDILPLEDTLAKVMRLRGVSYVMKADDTKERKIGVIAQELEQEYPELVATDDKGMKSVAYANLTAVLIEAVKGLKAENTAQKSEIDNLKTRLDRLEQLLSGK